MCIYLAENFRIKWFSYTNVTRPIKLGHNLHINFSTFLNQACQLAGRGMLGFLKLFLCRRLYVCLYVPALEALNN